MVRKLGNRIRIFTWSSFGTFDQIEIDPEAVNLRKIYFNPFSSFFSIEDDEYIDLATAQRLQEEHQKCIVQ